ncbi:hypothetical protein CVT25_005088 [Psilocybe cyanescens]|uniref:(4-O-methyl)-D-glucuronate--lignin esterase n=1 Tax=Psilocybe cyanescens TaxID=93625 RepID=A0A409XDX4_PSICY|nr:hypothetical protein CVT25_005088 [Psilocybe cyanescens]
MNLGLKCLLAYLVVALPALAQSSCGTLPASISFSDAKLSSPFVFLNGTAVTTKDQFACRQAEISALFQKYELGTLPPKPQSVTGSVSGNTISVTASNGGASISFTATITPPSGVSGKYPAIIAIGGSSIPSQPGVATIAFNNDDIALQNDGTSRGIGKFFTLYGANHSAGAMIAWTWGIARIIDVLESSTTHNIDVTKLGVTGCSRNGKGAFIAAAFEPRIALGLVQESGSGGAGCWRISKAMLQAGTSTQDAVEIVGENVWFSPNFNQYVNNLPALPFDHHMLAALVAPRGLLIIENDGIDWLGPQSVWGCQTTGAKNYQALGISDSMGISMVGNHAHCSMPSSQNGDVAAFVNRFLKGQSGINTNIMHTDGANNAGFVPANWVTWTVPTLSGDSLPPVATSSTAASGSSTVIPTTPATTATLPPVTTTAPVPAPQQTKYGQCGGNGWTGPTVCQSGSTCKAVSPPYYSQCL